MIVDALWWCAAVISCIAPRRIWPRLDPRLPLKRAASASGVLTLAVGAAIGVAGFFAFARQLASADNDWMLRQLANPAQAFDAAVGLVPYGVSVLTLFIFLFFTPLGLLSAYLVASGALRAVAAFIDDEDARGDPIWSGVDRVVARFLARSRALQTRLAREREEGEEVADSLVTAASVGLPGDLVVVASRRKAEWSTGAIVMTSTDWYRLGDPVDTRIDGRLRTLYPLTRMNSTEVVRRGIRYELPQKRKKP